MWDTFKSESSTLQEKLAKAESDLYKISNKANENRENLLGEIKTLKNVIDNLNADAVKVRGELSSVIYNLSRKNEKFEESIKNLKAEKSKLKNEKAKIESEIKKLQK